MNTTLENRLEENGLEQSFWIEILKDNGIENINQLQHADRKVLHQLNQHTRYAWEKNALEALLTIKETTDEEREQKQERLEKTSEILKERIKELKKANDENSRKEKMKINVQIPPGQKDLHKELMKMEQLTSELAERSELTSSKIVTRISAGGVLRGYHIQNDVWQRVIPRKQLISIPDQIELLAPRMEETFKSQEFFNEEKSGLHDHVVQHWGLNATASFGTIGKYKAEFGLSKSSADDTLQSEESNDGYTEIKETVYVPTASFSLENVPHYLSPEALRELIRLEDKLKYDRKIDIKLCQQFFDAFGSHFFAGTYHFGGRFTRSSICRSVKSMTRSDSIKLSKWALQAGGVGMIDWFIVGGFGEYNTTDDKSISRYKENEDYRVEKKIVKCGGPAEADSIQQWKLGLVKYPSTWNIINLDVHYGDWKGVWELLTEEISSKFQNIDRFRETLENAWKES